MENFQMPKLYYSAGACSMSCVIALEEMGVQYQPVLVDWDTDNQDLKALERLNPLKVAPVLETDDGKVLTQNIAILEYFADQKHATSLLPEPGSWERAQTMSWLSFVASDLHKAFVPLFGLNSISENETTKADIRKWTLKNLAELLSYVDKNLAGKDFITGKNFTIADTYLFVVAGWAKWLNVPLDSYSNLNAYMGRVYQRQSVQKALKMSGLLQ